VRGVQQGDAAVAVVQVGRRYGRHEQTNVRVGERVTLAPDDPPGWIVAALAPHADPAGAGGLRIEDGAGRAVLTPDPLTIGQREGMSQPLEHAGLLQAQEPAMHAGPGREVQRQMPPRT
jgi:hypothetical protein